MGGGILASLILIWTAPQTRPEEKGRSVRIVQTMAIGPVDERIFVTAEGPVVPARKVVIKPEVRGRIVRMHEALVPGGFIRAGEEVFGIDPSDYQLALNVEQHAYEEARFELELEKGRQVIAEREWRLLESDLAGSEVNRALVLREPHLRRTEAMIAKATNEIAKAKLNLSRTSVIAPFNAMVLDESVEQGQLVESGSAVCTLVGTDEYWVQAALPMDKLQWIRIPGPDQPGPRARVWLDTGEASSNAWEGTAFRLLGDLEPTGLMARVLVRVPDPLGLESGPGRLPLLVGSYAQVQIEAGELSGVLEISRAALREGNRIWVVNADKELRICETSIRWRRKDSVLIANCLLPGEQLIVSGLRTALPGMKVEPQPLGGVPETSTAGPPDPDGTDLARNSVTGSPASPSEDRPRAMIP